jgi:hypothetical protein
MPSKKRKVLNNLLSLSRKTLRFLMARKPSKVPVSRREPRSLLTSLLLASLLTSTARRLRSLLILTTKSLPSKRRSRPRRTSKSHATSSLRVVRLLMRTRPSTTLESSPELLLLPTSTPSPSRLSLALRPLTLMLTQTTRLRPSRLPLRRKPLRLELTL